MKIAYILGSLATQGGTCRMVIEKANLYANKFGYDVTIVTFYQKPDQEIVYSLSDAVKHKCIYIPFANQYKHKYPMRLWYKWLLHKQLVKELNETVQTIDPDIIIGVAQVEADIISTLKCRAKKVIECHEAKVFSLSKIGHRQSLLSRMVNSINRFRYFYTIERHADVICPLTEADKQLWKRAKHLKVIPNFSTMPVSRYSDCTPKRVIAIGRLEWEKGYSRLIHIWKLVSAKHHDWNLDIYGEGDMENTIRVLIQQSGVRNLTIHHFTPNISEEYAKSSICLLTSYFEGFSLVLLEAQKHGVPCVAFDCPFGPRGIISDSYSGFLVEDGEIRVFVNRVCRLIEDENLRHQFSAAAIERAKIFNVEIVINQWKELFESLTTNPS